MSTSSSSLTSPTTQREHQVHPAHLQAPLVDNWLKPFSVKLFRVPLFGFRAWLICGFVSVACSLLFHLCVVCFQLLLHSPTNSFCSNLFQRRHSHSLSAITTFDPVSDSTPTAVVTEIDEDSAFTEAHDSLRVLLSQGKRHSIEMNVSGSAREEGEPRLAGIAVGGMQVEDDIGDLDKTQAQEPDSTRLREGDAATDLLQRCAQDAANKATCEMKAYTSKLLKEAGVREQRIADLIAERGTERDAALVTKLESLVKVLSEWVDSKILNLSATVDKKIGKS